MKANFFPAFNHRNDSQLITWTVYLNVLISDICFSVILFTTNIGNGMVYQELFLKKKRVINALTIFCRSHRNQGDLILAFQSRISSTFPLSSFYFWVLSSCFPWVVSRMAPKVLPLICISSFSHYRFPGKLNHLHFSALEEGWKEARQNEFTLLVDRRDYEKTRAELGSTHVNCCIPFWFLHLQRLTMLFAIEND